MWSYASQWKGRVGKLPVTLLMVTALVVLCGYSLYSMWIAVQPFAGATVNLAGRQRMLSQQLAKELLLLVQDPSLAGRIHARQQIFGISAQFNRVQQGLEHGDISLGLSGENTDGTLKILAGMAPLTGRLTRAVDTIYGMAPPDLMRLAGNSPEVRGVLESVDALIVQYDLYIRETIAVAEGQIVRHKTLEIAVFVIAFVLIFRAQVVVRGLGKELQRFVRRLHGRQWLLKQEIQARHRAEEERRLMVAAVEQSADSIVITDSKGHLQFANSAFLRNTGYSLAEVLGKTQSIVKSGKQDPEFYRVLWETILSGEPWQGQMINRNKDGTLRTEAIAIFPIRDKQGRIRHFAGIKHDVTRETMLEHQLREAQRLEAIGTLVGGVAHDFNNILTPIIGFTALTMDLIPAASEAHENLGVVLSAANRAKDLIAEIRNTVRRSQNPDQAIPIASVTREVLKLVRSTMSKAIEVVEEIPPGLPAIRGETGDVHRLLMNLCVNACQAMSAGGRLRVALDLHDVQQTSGYLGDPAPGPFVRIIVEDTGEGMSTETLAHVFEPYFSTRRGTSGTGLGLFLVFNIVKQHKGGIRVISREGAGTSFEVILPVAQQQQVSEAASGGLEMPGHERVLFVDDEASIAKFAKSALERVGYRVTAISGGALAWASFEAAPDQFDIVFTDLSMPGLSGEELGSRIKRLRPGIPVIVCTGYCDETRASTMQARGFDACLLKPFAPGTLSAAIRKTLGPGSQPDASSAQGASLPC